MMRSQSHRQDVYHLHQWLLHALDTCDALERERDAALDCISKLNDLQLSDPPAERLKVTQCCDQRIDGDIGELLRENKELKEAFRILAKWGTIAPLSAVTSDTERQRLRDAVIEAARIRHSSPLAGAYVCPVCDAIVALDAFEKEHS